ncbi:bifunctional methylenetetrahydrofolate dehydrogenase/methenyltetrahydrofolate cyclohydrolase FolD [Allofrancisella guangzhouensis]|uniref:Bifunctional protein FolD n=1 Tax=Allofrancisella guangzhouensis TaxID=594679 RepID=A0A0A8E7P6_9GAMM|nr:bifunctional methylenetetrahydrofolate dehydrogenase/methenyltetrahydrofolate cyclohydrolase FolD [Allofrancisella guangzhouensis]AJC48166.1 5,10-methylene-tetrahydrofolate cyclohydrolase [Allofrancisella guangzhouensis]MBK2027030.1 bifunctional methylenetetrahydrofolate dehydrogenase/methenyltetrahydrofolate cyclohydrolase FolD [Allofrancisella guangzhouensis]MBK2044520.1 bifunctional methylenetetrahydrofolate dehydrogenase/methenyltetrahydrofolate cyclohydrolase FolD [Allofrancisella guangz
MTLIEAKALSQNLKMQLKEQIQEYKNQNGIIPKLVAVIVGDNPASQVYVSSKSKACAQVGMDSDVVKLPENISEGELIELIKQLNSDKQVNAILVQLPLPKHIDSQKIINSIVVGKDVDGFHPTNIGKLQVGDETCLQPCTPKGIMTMLKYYNVDLIGANAVVVGASNIVGKPMAQMLLNAKATVTICNSKTKDLRLHTQNADILVVAIGKDRFITADMIKPGAVVIDVGINRVGGKLYGDVDFEGVKDKVSAITPVPGGVGPMTITELLFNTFQCCKEQNRYKHDYIEFKN